VVDQARSIGIGAAPFARRAYLKSAALNAGLLKLLSKAGPKKVFSPRSKVVARPARASLPSCFRRGC